MWNDSVTATTLRAQTRRKIVWVVSALQLLAITYLVWVAQYVAQPIVMPTYFKSVIEQYWHLSMAEVNDWQLILFALTDLTDWLLLLVAVVYCCRALQLLKKMDTPYLQLCHWMKTGAWFALASWSLGVVDRPLKTLWLSLHLDAEHHVMHWNFYPNDLLVLLLCLTILAFAYLMTWTAKLAEESKGFI